MMGWSGTFNDMSALTVIFWPSAGTWMCWKRFMGTGLRWLVHEARVNARIGHEFGAENSNDNRAALLSTAIQ
ncbi:MAG: hypothetical protein C0477_24070 [Delftia sp.]|nr:hypothetical protein [Delftia sp.]